MSNNYQKGEKMNEARWTVAMQVRSSVSSQTLEKCELFYL